MATCSFTGAHCSTSYCSAAPPHTAVLQSALNNAAQCRLFLCVSLLSGCSKRERDYLRPIMRPRFQDTSMLSVTVLPVCSLAGRWEIIQMNNPSRENIIPSLISVSRSLGSTLLTGQQEILSIHRAACQPPTSTLTGTPAWAGPAGSRHGAAETPHCGCCNWRWVRWVVSCYHTPATASRDQSPLASAILPALFSSLSILIETLTELITASRWTC